MVVCWWCGQVYHWCSGAVMHQAHGAAARHWTSGHYENVMWEGIDNLRGLWDNPTTRHSAVNEWSEFIMARLYTIKRLIDTDAKRITMVCMDQDGKPTGDRLAFDMSKASESNVAYAALHGFNQRIGDAGALGFNKETGQYASPAEKFAAMQAVADHIMSGSNDWEMPRAASAPRADSTVELLVKALMIEDETRDEAKVRVWAKALDLPKRKALLRSDRLKDIVVELESKTAAQIDVDSIFEGLDSI